MQTGDWGIELRLWIPMEMAATSLGIGRVVWSYIAWVSDSLELMPFSEYESEIQYALIWVETLAFAFTVLAMSLVLGKALFGILWVFLLSICLDNLRSKLCLTNHLTSPSTSSPAALTSVLASLLCLISLAIDIALYEKIHSVVNRLVDLKPNVRFGSAFWLGSA